MRSKNKTWILVADSAKAKIFEWYPLEKHIKEIIQLHENDARKPERELKSDRPGHGHASSTTARYAVEDHANFKEQASQAFLKKVADLLCVKENLTEYDDLVIIVSEKVYHLIYENMSVLGQKKIIRHYAKNLTNMPILDLQKYYVNLSQN